VNQTNLIAAYDGHFFFQGGRGEGGVVVEERKLVSSAGTRIER